MPAASGRPFLVSGEYHGDVGQFEAVLAAIGRSILFVERWKATDVEFSPGKFAALVILGDTRHWATSKKYARDRAWLVAALESRKPVLAICYGAQLLAAHLAGIDNGRSLAKHPNKDHVGRIARVEFRDEGLSDPVMAPLRLSPLATMHHEDFFQEPPGAVPLAWSTDVASEHCEAFRVGQPENAVYGIQFHPEPTMGMLQASEKHLRWFDNVPNAAELSGVVETGRKMLEVWAGLATARG